jgi:hypothetical protein
MEEKERKIISWIFLGMGVLLIALYLLCLKFMLPYTRSLTSKPLLEILYYLYPQLAGFSEFVMFFGIVSLFLLLFGAIFIILGLIFRKREARTFAIIVCSLILVLYAFLVIPQSLWDLRNLNNPCNPPVSSVSEDSGSEGYSISVETIYTDGGKMYIENCKSNVRHLKGYVMVNSAFLVFNIGIILLMILRRKNDKTSTN